MRRSIPLLLSCHLAAGPAALAQGAHGTGPAPVGPDTRTPAERAQARFPQPVRVGDLAGRQLLENVPQQRVLGRVAGAVRGNDGAVRILVDRGGLLGFGTRRVAVPVEATALLGPFLVLMDLDAQAFAALPEVSGGGDPVTPGEVIRIGLTRN